MPFCLSHLCLEDLAWQLSGLWALKIWPDNEGEQTLPPQNRSCQHKDYFELKTVKTQQIQEKRFPSPSKTAVYAGKGPHQKGSYYQGQICMQNFICLRFSQHLLRSCEWHFFPLYPQTSTPFLSSRYYISHVTRLPFGSSYFYGPPIYKI